MAISQAAQQIGPFAWTEADPVSLTWRVDANWAGEYRCQVRKSRKPTAMLVATLEVTATWDPDAGEAGETLFTMTLVEPESVPVKAGKYACDVQQVGGVTRVWGIVLVGPQVTVIGP